MRERERKEGRKEGRKKGRKTSGQDGETSSHHHRGNYSYISKQISNHNCQKIELYGSPTTKDLKKPHSSIQIGGAQFQRQMERHRDVVWYGKVVAVAADQGSPKLTCGG